MKFLIKDFFRKCDQIRSFRSPELIFSRKTKFDDFWEKYKGFN